MNEEEQQAEIEVLESIYQSDFEIIGEGNLLLHLSLEEINRKLLVYVEYGPNYPESEVPQLNIKEEIIENNDDEDKIKEEENFNYHFTQSDLQTLLSFGNEVAEQNLGISSVFNIVSELKEKAEELFHERVAEIEAERLRKLEIEEAKEQEKFHGTAVTKESFAEWRLKFRKEMKLDVPKERKFGRLTGREIFERGLDTEEEEEEE